MIAAGDRRSRARTDVARVTTLELFFDLVFVFTIAELTSVLFAEPNTRGAVQVFLMLGVIWWMYGGYAWLTNAVTARTTLRRLLLLGGMGGYFVMSLAIPGAFEGSGLAFGLGYLAVVAVHSILFTRATGTAARGILTLAPFNLASAGLVLLGGALGGSAQYALWALAVALEWLTPWLRKPSAFAISPAHFVERHGLVVIVAHRRVGRRGRDRRGAPRRRPRRSRRSRSSASRSARACGGSTSAAATTRRKRR